MVWRLWMGLLNIKVKSVDLGWIQILDQLAEAEKSYVKVGFQVGSQTKTQKKGTREKKGGKSMPQIAAENEYGTKYIKPRPFMSTALDMNLPLIHGYIEKQYDLILRGKSTAYKSLGLIGQLMTGLIQKRIRQIVIPANSDRTIAIKKSSKPLIDFGQMIQSVRYVVVREQ